MNKLMQQLNRFRKNNQGIVLVVVVVITFVISCDIIGLVGALATSRVADALTPFVGSNVRALAVINNARNAYIVGLVVLNISLIAYLFISAQRKESQESPAQGVMF